MSADDIGTVVPGRASAVFEDTDVLTAQVAALVSHAGELGRIVARYERALQRLGLRGLSRILGLRNRLDEWEWIIERARLFDDKWYLKRYGSDTLGLKPLRHFLVCGTYEGRRPNPFFDCGFYLKSNTDVAASGMNPLVHYILHGAGEGRPASAEFDTRSYLDLNRDVDPARINPLRHYLMHGLKEGRPLSRTARFRPTAPDMAEFRRLAAVRGAQAIARDGRARTVNIIVPVYRNADETLSCLHSVLAAQCETPHDLIVIDDCGPERELSAGLEEIASLGLITLVKNARNIGFVASVNRGMALHPDCDVVLLNSDAAVYNNWLDRLAWHARQPGVGTVTPFSNNATICSYPHFNRGHAAVFERSYAEIDELAAECNRQQQVDLPTAVGFCMYIRREALTAFGDFDAANFGLGYGEENEFCARLDAAGWRNVLAADVFVRHTGEASFGGSSAALKQNAMRRLAEMHPTYATRVRTHIAANPALELRRSLDLARLEKACPGSPRVLNLTHTWGGGIEKHLTDEAKRLEIEGRGLLVLRPASNFGTRGILSTVSDLETPTLADLEIDGAPGDLVAMLRHLAVDAIAVHTLAGWSSDMVRIAPELSKTLGVPYDMTLHDYTPVCPRVQMVDASGTYCGEQGVKQCSACLSQAAPTLAVHGRRPFGRDGFDVDLWRRQYGRLLAGARRLTVPSADAARRYRRYFADLNFEVQPHREPPQQTGRRLAAPYAPGGMLRVAAIGAIGSSKGSRVLLAAARDAAERNLRMEFLVLGYTDIDSGLRELGNVRITGRYDEAEGMQQLGELGANLILLPSVWPETFSYTLSMAMAGGFPTAVFDIGAPAERIRAYSAGRVFPLAWSTDPRRLNDELSAWARSLVK